MIMRQCKIVGKVIMINNMRRSFVRFSSNGKYALVGTLDSTIRLWDYYTGECLKAYTGHKNEKFCCAGGFWLLSDGDNNLKRNYVVGGSEDGSVHLWDLQSKKLVTRLEGHIGMFCKPRYF
jgi:COMPASS component SWD3